MERYWTLQYLNQNAVTELVGTVFKDNMFRADNLPLVLPIMGAQGLPRGAQVRVRLGVPDLITLDINGTVVELLDAHDTGAVAGEDQPDEGEDDMVGGPIALAIDLADAAPGGLPDAPAQPAPLQGPV
jgi:exoribonuclease-2